MRYLLNNKSICTPAQLVWCILHCDIEIQYIRRCPPRNRGSTFLPPFLLQGWCGWFVSS
ncbi:hypothetical protein BDP27DRAFT_1329539, partial [Rhodocollybia butyracea]